jgi:hypothetical protein
MGLPIDRLSSRLPRRFPVGAKYVVEGYGGEEGNLRLIARYVVLPGGRRINVPADLSPACIAAAAGFPAQLQSQAIPGQRLPQKRRQKIRGSPRNRLTLPTLTAYTRRSSDGVRTPRSEIVFWYLCEWMPKAVWLAPCTLPKAAALKM